jgi:hypothetical protein
MSRRAVVAAGADASSDELIDFIARFKGDPYGFVLGAFPWGEEGSDLFDEVGPDKWQREFLEELGRQVRARDGNVELPAVQIAVASGHGVGKTTLLSWVILWFVSCRMDPTVTVTANTLGQLTGKTWRELAKWHRRLINADWFQWTATMFYLKDRPSTHKAEAVPWSKERSEAFQGAHAKHLLTVFDEGSGIDDSIWVATDGAMTTSGAIWLVFGNPTRNTGRFRECFRRFRHRWTVRQVDSRQAKMANRAQIQGWIDDYGEDSDFVRVRVKGEFPRAASTQLIGPDLVDAARAEWRRRVPDAVVKKALAAGPWAFAQLRVDPSDTAPRMLMVDVARFGDDQTVIGFRVGRTFVVLARYRGLDTVQVAHRASEWIGAFTAAGGRGLDAIFVDGSGVGGGVCDILRDGGHEIIEVNTAIRAMDERKYFNRRMEVWWLMRDWLKNGGAIPADDQQLADDLTGPEYGFAAKDRVQLETKDDMRARGVPSPDAADCLALSFAQVISPRLLEARDTVSERIAAAMAELGTGDTGAAGWQSR